MGAAPFNNAEMSVCYENENIFHANERNDVTRTIYVCTHKIYMRPISFARIIHIMRQFICAKLYSLTLTLTHTALWNHRDSTYKLWTHANFINFDKWNIHRATMLAHPLTLTSNIIMKCFTFIHFQQGKRYKLQSNSARIHINCRLKSFSHLNIVHNTHRHTRFQYVSSVIMTDIRSLYIADIDWNRIKSNFASEFSLSLVPNKFTNCIAGWLHQRARSLTRRWLVAGFWKHCVNTTMKCTVMIAMPPVLGPVCIAMLKRHRHLILVWRQKLMMPTNWNESVWVWGHHLRSYLLNIYARPV